MRTCFLPGAAAARHDAEASATAATMATSSSSAPIFSPPPLVGENVPLPEDDEGLVIEDVMVVDSGSLPEGWIVVEGIIAIDGSQGEQNDGGRKGSDDGGKEEGAPILLQQCRVGVSEPKARRERSSCDSEMGSDLERGSNSGPPPLSRRHDWCCGDSRSQMS